MVNYYLFIIMVICSELLRGVQPLLRPCRIIKSVDQLWERIDTADDWRFFLRCTKGASVNILPIRDQWVHAPKTKCLNYSEKCQSKSDNMMADAKIGQPLIEKF